MPAKHPTLPFKIGIDISSLYYETTQERANVFAEDKLIQNNCLTVLSDKNLCKGKTKKKSEVYAPLETEELSLKRSRNPIVEFACDKEECKIIGNFIYRSDYKNGIGSLKFNPRKSCEALEPHKEASGSQMWYPTSFQTKPQSWQCVPTVTWDRIQSRERLHPPLYPKLVSNARNPAIKQAISRNYPKDDVYFPPDDNLIHLIREHRLRPELNKPFPGYGGTKPNFFKMCSAADRPAKDNFYNAAAYQSTSRTYHKCFPANEYKKSSTKHRHQGDVSQSVSVLYPHHPFRHPQTMTGTWDNLLHQTIH